MQTNDNNAIAIIGLAGRFPGAKNVREFWDNLLHGIESITFFSDQELRESNVPSELLELPHYVKAGASLQDIDKFDAAFFGLTPQEAAILDPQQRFFLECAWEALEDAGYDPKVYEAEKGVIGIYGGAFMSTYLLNLLDRQDLFTSMGEMHIRHANDKDYLTTRVSYKLNLHGPSVNINTACSTSLVAVHFACQGLLNGECDMALAGGVTIKIPQTEGYLYQEGGILSADGHSRAFDARATGTLFGSGIGIVVLKRLAEAIEDQDDIYAVIRGSAINNDGGVKIGYTAPSIDGQAAVIEEALAIANVAPETITYVETHGTATPLGDPIEIMALRQAFASDPSQKQYCALGSVKTNIGHLSSAAGVAGLIKVALMLRHGTLVPSLHFEQANSKLSLAESPFYVNTQLRPWPADRFPRRAGISSFGMGGTNAHIIVEEYRSESVEPEPATDDWHILPLSACSAPALEDATHNLTHYLQQEETPALTSLATTLQDGRHAFAWRRVLLAQNNVSLSATLAHREPAYVSTGHILGEQPRIVFLFPGQGAQYANMARDLYNQEPVLRRHLDHCSRLFEPYLKTKLVSSLYPDIRHPADDDRLKQTYLAQPALFALEYALARWWMELGITPDACCGQSLGEYVAACLAGVFSLEDAVYLVAMRGKLMQSLPVGSMLAVFMSESDLLSELPSQLALAAVNSQQLCVVAGPRNEVETFHLYLEQKGIVCRPLETSHAFHSQMMDPALEAFKQYLCQIKLQRPRLPVVSNLTGTWLTSEEAQDPMYWVRHLRQTVRLADNLQAILALPERLLLEVGPGHNLISLAKRMVAEAETPFAFASMRDQHDATPDRAFLLGAVGKVWQAGGTIDWLKVRGGKCAQKVHLPTYPFERQRYWIESTSGNKRQAIPNRQVWEESNRLLSTTQSAKKEGLAEPESIEQRVTTFWQEGLGLPHIAPEQNFFALGGHSLLALQIISRLVKEFQIALPVQTFFEKATIAELSAYIRQETGQQLTQDLMVIPTIEENVAIPLSPAQQRLWFLHQIDTQSTLYTIAQTVRLTGPLHRGALVKTMHLMADRHEILRTVFSWQSHGPIQVVLPALQEGAFPLIDLRAVYRAGSKTFEDFLRQQLLAVIQQPFDLERGPLIRALLWQLTDNEYIFQLTLHHIISDGWSMHILMREIAQCYSALIENRPVDFPELPVRYRDYAHWQQRWEAINQQQQLAFWKEQLADTPMLVLPTDYPHSRVEDAHGAELPIHFSPALNRQIRSLAQREAVTPFVVLLSTFLVLLARLSQQYDFAIGTSVANRTHVDIEDVVGLFINMLAIRTNLSGNPTFLEVLQRVRHTTQQAYSHQDVSFERVVEAVQPARVTHRLPLFQISFELHNTPVPSIHIPGLHIEPSDLHQLLTKYELMVEMVENAEGFSGVFRYSTVLFEPATIERMIQRFQVLLKSLTSDPEQRLEEPQVLSMSELAQIIGEWNATSVAYPLYENVYTLFVKQAQTTPDTCALRQGDAHYTYRYINQHVQILIAHLENYAPAPEEVIGVLMDRGYGLLTSLLAILGIGGSYLPLDSSHPVERQKQLLRACNCKLLLVEQHPPAHLEIEHSIPIAPLLHAAPITNDIVSRHRVAINQMAYVLYTSGSTDTPKGVMISQEGMLNHLRAKIDDLQLAAHDSVAQTASQCFDISIWQYLAVLLVGGCVEVVPDTITHDPESLFALMSEKAISIMEAVPSLLNAWLAAQQQQLPQLSIRLMLVTGEELTPTVCQRWFYSYPDIPLLNAYGPTECSDDVTHYRIMQSPGEQQLRIPIGRAIANTRLYILDQWLQPVPISTPGELYVGGTGVGRGYYADPQRTAPAFIPDPWSASPGARMYKTGDRARYLPDGLIEFLGRIDYQVKLRGYRIELGEIETVLRTHIAIREAVVQMWQDQQMLDHLVGYVTLWRADRHLSEQELRRWVQQRLPAYMIPATFIFLDEMPLAANGKIDRRALPVPPLLQSEETPQRPEKATEEIVSSIWASVLDTNSPERNQDFFELGGHSLLAMQVIARIRQALSLDISLKTLFEYSTLEQFTEQVQHLLQQKVTLDQPPLLAHQTREHLPLSFAQQRLWFLAQMEPDSPFYNVPAAFRLKGKLHLAAMEASLRAITQRHEVLRTVFHTGQEQPLLSIYKELPDIMELIDLREILSRDELAHRLALQDMRTPFNLAQGPLLRVKLFQVAEDEYIVALTMHHIVSDGWSISVFAREFIAAYEAFVQGTLPRLPALSIQYADYAAWQHKYLQSPKFDRVTAYWKTQLDGVAPLLSLPTDRPRPKILHFQGKRVDRLLPYSLTPALKTFCHQEDITLFMLLLATFQLLLMSYTGKDDGVIGTDVANRQLVETEGLIGFFVNQLVLRIDLSGNPTFTELLARVRQTTLDGYLHQDMPFDRLVHLINPKRSLQYSPLFQVKLVLLNMPFQVQTEITGLTLHALEVNLETAQLDINVRASETSSGLALSVEYNTELFDEIRIASMLEDFECMLEVVTMDPLLQLSSLLQQLRALEYERRKQRHVQIEVKHLQKLRALKKRR